MRHEHAARALVKLMQIGKTPSGADPVLHHPPEPFDGIEMVAAMSWQEMQPKLSMVVVECGVELVRPMDPATIDDHHDLFCRFAEGRHHLVDILAQLLRIKMRHDFIKDSGGAILDSANNAEQHPAGHAAPTPIRQPRLAFEALVAFDLTLGQRAHGQASALRFAPPACPRQGKAPEDGFILIEQNDLTPTGLVLQSSECERGISEVSGLGIESPGGTAVADVFFFNTSRTLSRLSWTPVWRASTVASS